MILSSPPSRMTPLASVRAAPDDAPVIPEVEGLAADERGLVLGLLRSGAAAGAGLTALAGPGADRCRAALAAVEALPPEARAAEGRARPPGGGAPPPRAAPPAPPR